MKRMATEGVDGRLAQDDGLGGGDDGDGEEATVFAGTRSQATPRPGGGAAQLGADGAGRGVAQKEDRVGAGIGVVGILGEQTLNEAPGFGELAQVDEQFSVVNGEAEDHAIRALVSETPLADHEARDARRHAEALARHRAHLIESIVDLERRQDELLDEMVLDDVQLY